jgi:hypothetical protein
VLDNVGVAHEHEHEHEHVNEHGHEHVGEAGEHCGTDDESQMPLNETPETTRTLSSRAILSKTH